MIPVWMWKEANKPRVFRPDGMKSTNILYYGSVGGGKTLACKSRVDLAAMIGFNTVILDTYNEYTKYKSVKVSIEMDFLNLDMIKRLIRSEGNYTEFIPDFLEGSNSHDLEDELSSQQISLIHLGIRRLEKFMEGDGSVVELINKYHNIRVVIDRDFSGEQIILILLSLTSYSEKIDPCRGTIVVLEEQESLSRVDTSNLISQCIFEGRKKGIYYVVISHQSPDELRRTTWGAGTVRQFDTIINYEGGRPFVR